MADERILVVDDEESIRWVLSRGLARRGWRVESAENAHLALRRLTEQRYALVFLDIRLPDLDGRLHSLSEHRGRKALLIAYASW